MSDHGFRNVPGVPEGWELVGIGVPDMEDYWLDSSLKIRDKVDGIVCVKPIVRKIEKPKRYRPFANAEEFKPHRDRWWRDKGKSYVYAPSTYGDDYHCGASWESSFVNKLFDDGSPFGVELNE
jgi:hypothetical protein